MQGTGDRPPAGRCLRLYRSPGRRHDAAWYCQPHAIRHAL